MSVDMEKKRERKVALTSLLITLVGTIIITYVEIGVFHWDIPWWAVVILFVFGYGIIYQQQVKQLALRRQAGLEK